MRKYKCKLCGHKTKCKKSMKVHIQIRHNIPPLKVKKFIKRIKGT